MLSIRRIDMIAQAVIAGISLLSLLTFSIYFCLIGEAVLGAWQLMSAVCNTFYMNKTQYARRIRLYWILTSVALLSFVPGNDVLGTISLIGSWGIAAYYWLTYRSFIEYLGYRKELSTITRNR